MDKCTVCGSDRILIGPAYDRLAATCLDCGSQFNRDVIVEPEPDELSVAFSEVEFNPVTATVAEAQAHLEKLKNMKREMSKGKEDRPNKVNRKKHPESDTDPNVVSAVYHFYQRSGESWQEVLNVGKGERAVRNYSVLIWCHNHIVSQACTPTCREVIDNG